MENKKIPVRAKDELISLTSEREVIEKDGKKVMVTDILEFGAYKGNPRFTLKRGKIIEEGTEFKPDNKEDFLKSITTVAFKPLAFSIFINEVKKDAITEKEEFETKYLGYNNKFVNGTRTKELYLQGEVMFSRDDEGNYFITIKEENKIDGVFKLEFSEYFDIEKKTVKIKNKRIQSMSAFKSYVNLIIESATAFRLKHISDK